MSTARCCRPARARSPRARRRSRPDPARGALGDGQQGLRLRHAHDRARRPGDRVRRRRARVAGAWSRCRRPLPAARGALRLPDGDEAGGRRDDSRRAHEPVHRQADDQRGERGLERARDHPPRHGPLGGALAPARGQGHRRGTAGRGDRLGDGEGRKAENVVEADEAIRPDSTVETLAKLPAVGGDDATTPPATRPASTTARAR